MLDLDRRLQRPRRVASVLFVLGLLPLGVENWWVLAPGCAALVVMRVLELEQERIAHPELAILGHWLGVQIVIGVCVLGAGMADSAAMTLMVVPIPALSARQTRRGTVVGVVLALLVLTGVQLGGRGVSAVWSDPVAFSTTTVLILIVAVISSAIVESDVEHRTVARVDELTGLLNRHALRERAEELRLLVAHRGGALSVVLGDIDHFKQVNDTHGHVVGDATLQAAANLLRAQLRAFDLVFRFGGEEFLIVAPDVPEDAAAVVAETLRAAVAGDPATAGSVPVTMSFGVAACPPGTRLDLDALISRADEALYAAKAAGRNTVRGAAQPPPRGRERDDRASSVSSAG